MSESFTVVSERFLKRRTLLKAAGALGASAVVPGWVRADVAAPGFKPLPLALETGHAVAAGYSADVLIAWGDGLDGSASPGFPLSEAAQAARFGCNNDFIAYTPLDGSRRGLLGVNHEYPVGHLMFPGYTSHADAKQRLKPVQVRSEMAAVGHSVIEIERKREGWRVVPESRYARRLHAGSPVGLDGPAAGSPLLRTGADPRAEKVRGVLGCCSGGKTPWGTVLIAEENVGDFFRGISGDADMLADPDEVFGQWADIDARFDLRREPNELNRFGWIVEYDPRQPTSAPVKHTALGRFEHEGATVVAQPGQPLVIYSGDDGEGRAVYRYVSDGRYTPGDEAGNRTLLSDGTLYCARFADDGSGQWLPLRHGSGPLVASNGFADQAEVLVNARRAAREVGATPMDRPEGIAVDPISGRVYLSMTRNTRKPGVNAANPRAVNAAGHILEITPPVGSDGAAHWADTFAWDLLLQGGDDKAVGDARGVYGAPPPAGAWLANPDNLAFDARGRLWIATDGMNRFGAADGLWCTDIDGAGRAVPQLFFRCPRGAELCSPEFTPDGQTLFVAVQHPADEAGSTFGKPSTRWPDFEDWTPPRSAVVAITRDGGGLVGD